MARADVSRGNESRFNVFLLKHPQQERYFLVLTQDKESVEECAKCSSIIELVSIIRSEVINDRGAFLKFAASEFYQKALEKALEVKTKIFDLSRFYQEFMFGLNNFDIDGNVFTTKGKVCCKKRCKYR